MGNIVIGKHTNLDHNDHFSYFGIKSADKFYVYQRKQTVEHWATSILNRYLHWLQSQYWHQSKGSLVTLDIVLKHCHYESSQLFTPKSYADYFMSHLEKEPTFAWNNLYLDNDDYLASLIVAKKLKGLPIKNVIIYNAFIKYCTSCDNSIFALYLAKKIAEIRIETLNRNNSSINKDSDNTICYEELFKMCAQFNITSINLPISEFMELRRQSIDTSRTVIKFYANTELDVINFVNCLLTIAYKYPHMVNNSSYQDFIKQVEHNRLQFNLSSYLSLLIKARDTLKSMTINQYSFAEFEMVASILEIIIKQIKECNKNHVLK